MVSPTSYLIAMSYICHITTSRTCGRPGLNPLLFGTMRHRSPPPLNGWPLRPHIHLFLNLSGRITLRCVAIDPACFPLVRPRLPGTASYLLLCFSLKWVSFLLMLRPLSVCSPPSWPPGRYFGTLVRYQAGTRPHKTKQLDPSFNLSWA